MEQTQEDIQYNVHTRAPKVVVVGAGFAGVAAMGALREGGIHDVTLLEACDRPGGRVKSVIFDKGFIELGAQFLHGKHVVYEIAEREGLLEEEDPDDEELPDTVLQFKDYVFRTSDGNTVCGETVDNNLQVLEDLIINAEKEVAGTWMASDVSVSMGQFYRERYHDVRATMVGTEDLKTAMFRWFEVWDCTDRACKGDQHSLAGSCQFIDFPGSGIMQTTKGMETVLQCLVRDWVPPEHLYVSKPVRAICWTGSENYQTTGKLWADTSMVSLPSESQYGLNNHLVLTEKSENAIFRERSDESTNHSSEVAFPYTRREVKDIRGSRFLENNKTTDDSDNGKTLSDFQVRIECEDGDVFYADHVIVTPSIGFLAHNPDFFQPQLPSLHQKAIGSIGFGDVAKMFLFWGEEDIKAMNTHPGTKASDWWIELFGNAREGMIPLWLPNANAELKSAKYCTKMSNGHHWYQELAVLHPVHSHELCLVVWTSGQAAIIMESLPESEVKDVLYELLVRFLDKPDLPAPRWFTRTTWCSNPYTRGAYSYPAINVPLELRDVLRQPLPSVQNPVMQLAGEACSKHYYATVHGAFLSGQDAARVLLRHYSFIQ